MEDLRLFANFTADKIEKCRNQVVSRLNLDLVEYSALASINCSQVSHDRFILKIFNRSVLAKFVPHDELNLFFTPQMLPIGQIGLLLHLSIALLEGIHRQEVEEPQSTQFDHFTRDFELHLEIHQFLRKEDGFALVEELKDADPHVGLQVFEVQLSAGRLELHGVGVLAFLVDRVHSHPGLLLHRGDYTTQLRTITKTCL